MAPSLEPKNNVTSAMQKLQHLSLINKVTKELDKNLGVNDKTLAEFIVDIAKASKFDPKTFFNELQKNGAELPEPFANELVGTIERLANKGGGGARGGEKKGGNGFRLSAAERKKAGQRQRRGAEGLMIDDTTTRTAANKREGDEVKPAEQEAPIRRCLPGTADIMPQGQKQRQIRMTMMPMMTMRPNVRLNLVSYARGVFPQVLSQRMLR